MEQITLSCVLNKFVLAHFYITHQIDFTDKKQGNVCDYYLEMPFSRDELEGFHSSDLLVSYCVQAREVPHHTHLTLTIYAIVFCY